jgi:hypothetical protein
VLIDETYAYNPPSYNAASFATNFGFDGAGAKIFRVDGLLGGVNGNGYDWFEGAYSKPSVVLEDFVAALHSTGANRTYLRKLDESPTVMTAADCEKQLPACNDVAAAATIEAPCDRYQVCAPDASTTVATGSAGAASQSDTTTSPSTPRSTTAAPAATQDQSTTAAPESKTVAPATTNKVAQDSACVAGGLLLAAAAFA